MILTHVQATSILNAASEAKNLALLELEIVIRHGGDDKCLRRFTYAFFGVSGVPSDQIVVQTGRWKRGKFAADDTRAEVYGDLDEFKKVYEL